MMKSILLTLACLTLMAVVCSTVYGVPDPWRIKVSDLDPLGPLVAAYAPFSDPTALAAETGWGTNGGLFRHWEGAWWTPYTAISSYNASTGAISFGTATTCTTAGWDKYQRPVWRALKVGSLYKKWHWSREYNGQDILYSTSADAANFSTPTRCTIYGSAVTSSGTYSFASAYLSTGGVYLIAHNQSGGAANPLGMATSGSGETEWYDIDTGKVTGDPIEDPDGTYGVGSYYSLVGNPGGSNFIRTCSGNLGLIVTGTEVTVDNKGWGVGLTIGDGGELVGGDQYSWLCDPNSTSTALQQSLLSAINLPGLSGPSLRTKGSEASRNWVAATLGLKAKQTDPATQFATFYYAHWDTNSDGAMDSFGMGHAKLLLTRNKADLNYDGTVNFQDIGPFSGAYGSTSGTPGSLYNVDCDFNADGKIDFKDIGPLSGRYGTDCSYSP